MEINLPSFPPSLALLLWLSEILDLCTIDCFCGSFGVYNEHVLSNAFATSEGALRLFSSYSVRRTLPFTQQHVQM